MADIKKSESKVPDEQSVAVEEQMSVEDIDQMLAEEDPTFFKAVSKIGDDKDLSMTSDVVSEDEQALVLEQEAWARSGRGGRLLYFLVPFIPRLSLKWKRFRKSFFPYLRSSAHRIKGFFHYLFTTGIKKFVHSLKSSVAEVLTGLRSSVVQFGRLSWKLKLSFLGILILLSGTGYFIFRSFKYGIIHKDSELFIPHFERVADSVYQYDPAVDVEPFYDNLRASKHLLLMPKMVVNLTKVGDSATAPMGAFEFFVEGMSSEVIIEIKDREVEMRDLMQRVVEQFTFEKLDTAEGKKEVCDRLKKEVNVRLSTGKLKKVWIKTVILKP
jgi:flagellar basal body-associated protein FliL